MFGRLCHQDREGEAKSIGRTQQMGELNREPKAEDDGAEQLPQREEGRTGKVQRLTRVAGQSRGGAEDPHQQTFQQRMIIVGQCLDFSILCHSYIYSNETKRKVFVYCLWRSTQKND